MNDLDRLFVRRPRAIRVKPFTPDQADKIDTLGTKPIHYIRTREGLRHISTDMLIAEKSNTYRHPMDPQVLQREYVNILAYDSAFVAELKQQVADQLFRALESDNPMGEIELIASLLSVKTTQASLHQEHDEE